MLLCMRMCGARAFSVLHGKALACFCLSCMGLCLLVMRVAVVCLCVAQGLSVKAGAKSMRKSKTQKQNPKSVTVTSLPPPSLPPSPSPFPSPVLPGSLCTGATTPTTSPVVVVVGRGAVDCSCLLQEQCPTRRRGGGRRGWGWQQGCRWQLGHRPRLVCQGGRGVSLLQRKGRAEQGDWVPSRTGCYHGNCVPQAMVTMVMGCQSGCFFFSVTVLFCGNNFCSTMHSWFQIDMQLRSAKFVLPDILPE